MTASTSVRDLGDFVAKAEALAAFLSETLHSKPVDYAECPDRNLIQIVLLTDALTATLNDLTRNFKLTETAVEELFERIGGEA
jgi:hypothetical protein